MTKALTSCPVKIANGNIVNKIIKIAPPKTNVAASGRFIFFAVSLSTSGFREHAITNDAKNNIAISFILVINLINKIAIIKGGKIINSGLTEDVKGDSSLEEVFLELYDKE